MLSTRQNNFRRLVWNHCGYQPYYEQAAAHADTSRLKLIAGGVGAGKTYWLARELDAYTVIENGLGWLIGPDYDQIRRLFDYLLEPYMAMEIVDLDSVSRPTRGPCRFKTLWGFEWQTKSATDPIALATRRPNAMGADEMAQNPYVIFDKMIERGAENNAPVVMVGTFEESNYWYAEMWERWQASNPENGQSFSFPTWANTIKYPGGRDDPKIKEVELIMDPDLFAERFGGEPRKPSGLVFKRFDRKIHLRPQAELFDPARPIELWVDPATHTYSVLFVQIQADGETVHILDEIYAKDMIGQEVIRDVVAKPWWHLSCGRGVMDIAGSFRAGANKSQVQVWEDELRSLNTHPISWQHTRVWNAMDWYDAINLRLAVRDDGEPRLRIADHLNDRINADGSVNGIIGEFLTHRWPKAGEQAPTPGRPLKRNEDALSGLGYGLLVHFGSVVKRKALKRPKVRSYL